MKKQTQPQDFVQVTWNGATLWTNNLTTSRKRGLIEITIHPVKVDSINCLFPSDQQSHPLKIYTLSGTVLTAPDVKLSKPIDWTQSAKEMIYGSVTFICAKVTPDKAWELMVDPLCVEVPAAKAKAKGRTKKARQSTQHIQSIQ